VKRWPPVLVFGLGVVVGAAMVYLTPPSGPHPAPTSGGHEVAVVVPVRPADAGPPPPVGAGPPDDAEGPPLPEGDDGFPGQNPGADVGGGEEQGGLKSVVGRPPSHTHWLDEHLQGAREFWEAQAREAESSSDTRLQALAEDARALARLVPEVEDRPPPLQEVVVLLAEERRVYQDMKAIGHELPELERQLVSILGPGGVGASESGPAAGEPPG